MDMTIEKITPAKAREYLLANHDNRPLRKRRVDQYADMMTRGQWVFTGDPIRFDPSGRLLDGQHKLSAIAQSGTTQEMVVQRGVPTEAFKVIDAGMARSIGDTLGFDTGDRNKKAAICRILWVVEAGGDPRLSTDRAIVSRTDVSDYYELHHARIDAATSAAYPLYYGVRGGNHSAWACFIDLAWAAIGETSDNVSQFLTGIETGANLGAGDPRLALRNFLANGNARPSAGHHLHLYIKAWNYWMLGEQRQNIQSRADEAWPDLRKRRTTPRGTTVTDDIFLATSSA